MTTDIGTSSQNPLEHPLLLVGVQDLKNQMMDADQMIYYDRPFDVPVKEASRNDVRILTRMNNPTRVSKEIRKKDEVDCGRM